LRFAIYRFGIVRADNLSARLQHPLRTLRYRGLGPPLSLLHLSHRRGRRTKLLLLPEYSIVDAAVGGGVKALGNQQHVASRFDSH
jgi:hypothetical protein